MWHVLDNSKGRVRLVLLMKIYVALDDSEGHARWQLACACTALQQGIFQTGGGVTDTLPKPLGDTCPSALHASIVTAEDMRSLASCSPRLEAYPSS